MGTGFSGNSTNFPFKLNYKGIFLKLVCLITQTAKYYRQLSIIWGNGGEEGHG